jgi:hypothetical protein
MMPDNAASTIPISGVMLSPDGDRSSSLEDFEKGGVAIQNTSQGLMAYKWRLWVAGFTVKLQRDGDPTVTNLFDQSGIEELALAFDQNMRPTVAYKLTDGFLYLRWYNSVTSQYVTSTFAPGRNPRLTLDDKRIEMVDQSDVLFAYLRPTENGWGLFYRQQRDRYEIERLLRDGLTKEISLKDIGMTHGLRVQFELG